MCTNHFGLRLFFFRSILRPASLSFILLYCLLGNGVCPLRATETSSAARPAEAVLERLLPQLYSQIELRLISDAGGRDFFRISGEAGHIHVEGTSQSSLLFGVNWYLKYVAQLQISTNGSYLAVNGQLPAPHEVIERASRYPYRYALNENTDGYTTPYWKWPRWEHEVDILAMSGINAMLVERGTDAVLYETFRDFGYSDREIRRWITQPAHQNWQLMGNLCCFDEPISNALLKKRVESARQILARLRSLGITPVLPGYYGIVPADFSKKHRNAHMISQGKWNGFERPAWLDPRDPMYARIAAAFYRHQTELFGSTTLYDMDTFQEGGTSGGVPVAAAAHHIQLSLLAAHPSASWMLLGWQQNPPAQLLKGVDRSHILVIDIEQDRTPHDDREKDFQGAPYLFGGLWDFGGRTTLGANLYDYGVRLPQLAKTQMSKLSGTAVFPEGIDTNPFVFDLFTEMAWRGESLDLADWTSGYVRRRYGMDDSHAQQAWRILLQTAYGNRADGVSDHGERDAAQESLFNAQPSLTANRASTWAPDMVRYDPAQFNQALVQLLQCAPAVQTTETYRYDLVDVARQVIGNESRLLLPQIKAAYEAGDEQSFMSLTQRWQHLMVLQDRLLATNRSFLLGSWLQSVQGWASSEEEGVRLNYDARSLLTTWGNRKASEAGLHDYGNKDWAGLTLDYYLMRWKLYFASLDTAMKNKAAPEPIDWYALGDTWSHGRQSYPIQPQGDSYAAALQVAHEIHLLKMNATP
jgi:alpha-N-acetylglucosaminidase